MSINTALRDMRCEIKIMTKLNHKNIVQIKGFVEGNLFRKLWFKPLFLILNFKKTCFSK